MGGVNEADANGIRHGSGWQHQVNTCLLLGRQDYCRTIFLNRSGNRADSLERFHRLERARRIRSVALRQNGWGQPFYTFYQVFRHRFALLMHAHAGFGTGIDGQQKNLFASRASSSDHAFA